MGDGKQLFKSRAPSTVGVECSNKGEQHFRGDAIKDATPRLYGCAMQPSMRSYC